MNGGRLSFTEADLAATTKHYDPSVHEAPIVAGHPRHNSPAYGWIKKLAHDNGALEAVPDQVDPSFAEAVRAGRYRNISASFYRPDSPSNPVPGVYYLRHVGFLGAAAPAVKGLRPVEFSEDEEGVVEFADLQAAGSVFRRLREWIIGKFGIDEADQAVPGYLIAEMQTPPREAPSPAFAEPQQETESMNDQEKKEKELAEQRAALEKERAEFAEARAAAEKEKADAADRENKLAEREAQLARAGAASFIEGLEREGKVLPKDRDFLVSFMSALSAEETVEFGEGDGKKSATPLEGFKSFLTGMPKIVDFSERAPGGGEPPSDDAEAMAREAVAFQEDQASKGITVTVTEAVRAVREGKNR